MGIERLLRVHTGLFDWLVGKASVFSEGFSLLSPQSAGSGRGGDTGDPGTLHGPQKVQVTQSLLTPDACLLQQPPGNRAPR